MIPTKSSTVVSSEENKINVLTMKLPVLCSIVSLTYLHWLITALHSTCTRYNIIHSITAASHAFLSGSAFYSWNLTLPVRNYSEHRTHLSKFNSMMLFGPLNRQTPEENTPKSSWQHLTSCCNAVIDEQWLFSMIHGPVSRERYLPAEQKPRRNLRTQIAKAAGTAFNHQQQLFCSKSRSFLPAQGRSG